MQESEAMMMIIVMPTFLGASVWVFKMFLDFLRQRRMSRMLYEIQTKVLDKFGNSPEALEYLQSDAGRQYLDMAMTEKANPRTRILSAVQIGVVLAALAAGFLLVREMVPEGTVGFAVAGVLGLCIGIGYLVSAAAAYYLSKSWGLFNGHDSDDTIDI